MQERLRVLVTNDDGVDSPGIHTLAAAAHAAGHEVVVAAPLRDHSGFGAALGPLHLTGTVAFERRVVDGLADEIAVLGVDGPPALCALAACLGGFGRRPDVVLSGINVGANLGRAVLHSGTVGAVLTANNFGISGVAVSQVHGGDEQQWSTAAAVAMDLLEWTAAADTVLTLNVNVPNVAHRPRNVLPARLDDGGEVQSRMVEATTGVLSLHLGSGSGPEPGTDAAVVADGCVAITPIGGVRALEIDLSGVVDQTGRAPSRRVA